MCVKEKQSEPEVYFGYGVHPADGRGKRYQPARVRLPQIEGEGVQYMEVGLLYDNENGSEQKGN